MAKKHGGIEYLSAIMLICLAGIVLLYVISVKEVKQYLHMAKDSLDSSCLAASLINLDKYAENREIIMDDYHKLREIFCETLKCNMKLDNNYEPEQGAVYDKVYVHAFNIYYISDGKLYSYTGNGDSAYDLTVTDYSGNEKNPDGVSIESGMVYADIGMDVCTYFGIKKYVHITSGTDVIDE